MISCRTRYYYFIYDKISNSLFMFGCRFHYVPWRMSIFGLYFFRVENSQFVPQGNIRTNWYQKSKKETARDKRPTRNQSNTRKRQREIRQQPCAFEEGKLQRSLYVTSRFVYKLVSGCSLLARWLIVFVGLWTYYCIIPYSHRLSWRFEDLWNLIISPPMWANS